MLHKNPEPSIRHISDEELVRSADGELSSEQGAEVDAHLEACWDCRARMEDLQSTITSLVRAHHAEYERQLPPIAGSRSLLQARLRQLASERRVEWWAAIFQLGTAGSRVAVVGLSLIAISAGILWFRQSTFHLGGVSPNRGLTPGATRQVTMSEVCSVSQEQVVGDVSVSLRKRVLEEYGIANAAPKDYEIDYLIAPGLGGTGDIRNLWPEPYGDRLWNAHVKDALEERLHEMVCTGQVDLATAQRDIASDWISAYKKYFHTNKPLPPSS